MTADRRGDAQTTVGVLARRGRFFVARSLFRRGRSVSLARKAVGSAGAGDLVVVSRPRRGRAEVTDNLGSAHVARNVIEALMRDNGLERGFPGAVERDARRAQRTSDAETPRRDLRDLATLTVDPPDAKDFDDAISAERRDGGIRLWVHIADVTAHVRPQTALEAEAFRRGTSVYMPGTVEPMLPEVLSSDLCSIVPGADRPAVTVEMELADAEVKKVSFYRSTIRSDARLTYGEVDRIFEGAARAQEPWGDALATAREAARALGGKGAANGALQIDSREPGFVFDQQGQVAEVHYERQTESHKLIEQLMVRANEQVASFLAARRLPTLYRVHERPDPTAVEFLLAQLDSLGIATPPTPDHLSPQQAAEVVAEASRLVDEHVRRTGHGRKALTSLVLRSVKQAFYTPKNLGHAGLSLERYCHFTSPIRRYPDIVCHRALLEAVGSDNAAPRADWLPEAGAEASLAERNALELERFADDICNAFLLQRRLYSDDPARKFEGEVVGLVGGGAFVSFGEELFEGFLPGRTLSDDWWQLNETGTVLATERGSKRLRLGDQVTVVVDRVDPPRGRVDLLPARTRQSG